MGHRGEDKDKYSQPESGQKARKMTPLDSGAAFHYLMQSIHSLALDGLNPKNTRSYLYTALQRADVASTDPQEWDEDGVNVHNDVIS